MYMGGRAWACGALEGWKVLAFQRHTSLQSIELGCLKPYTAVPLITPSLRTFLGSLKSRQEALGTASPPPGSPGARNGRAADSGARTRRGGGRA